MKRILDCTTRDFATYKGQALKQAILAAEGRTVCCEMVSSRASVGGNITNAEIARAFGADLMLLNGFDVFKPGVFGLHAQEDVIYELKKLVGRPIGINLEPVDTSATMLETRLSISKGRTACVETFQEAEKLGVDFICLTGNPKTGVTNQAIAEAITLAKQHFSGLVIAGKMHGSGSKEPVCSRETVNQFVASGADVILVPAVGTVPGFTDAELIDIVKAAHQADALVLSAIGTSQESSSKEVIESIAIRNKVAGVDIQHIGDSGFGGLANVENIFALSVAIRGLRHTINRVSISVNRDTSDQIHFGNSQ
ncbi:haloacid dehalogenase-like hydrolase [Carnobacteriaceae bacterium zg-ZUI252]|nr:haloacid dehalogenase-like hydrolase [Carnobacteriaceae bacterium zg-ZUI252]